MMPEEINIIQLNVNHCAAAQNLLTQTAKERNADVVLLSEPYLPGVGEQLSYRRVSTRSPRQGVLPHRLRQKKRRAAR